MIIKSAIALLALTLVSGCYHAQHHSGKSVKSAVHQHDHSKRSGVSVEKSTHHYHSKHDKKHHKKKQCKKKKDSKYNDQSNHRHDKYSKKSCKGLAHHDNGQRYGKQCNGKEQRKCHGKKSIIIK